MLLKALRNGLGLIIVFIDWLTRPKKIQRTKTEQENAQNAVQGLSLYQFYACPFCVKTRRAVHKLNVNIETRDINKEASHRQALLAGGGRVKVPCLRIEENDQVQWMYESSEIIDFLQRKVA